jgi:ComF family protein
MLRAVGRLFLDAVAPHRCAGCDLVCVGSICTACEERIVRGPLPGPRQLDTGIAAAAFVFGGAVREVVHRAKYGSDREALRALSRLAIPRLARHPLIEPHAVVAVPLGARRRRQRGYNQAEVVAGVLGDAAGVPLAPGLLRTRETSPQANRDEAARRANLAGAFRWQGAALDGAAIWLVDDVLTTGATAGAAAAALAVSGAARVDIVVLGAVV